MTNILAFIETAFLDVGLIGAAVLIVVVVIASARWLEKPVH